MKNFDVNTSKINEGFSEAAKVLDHYALARWIVPCLECGEWLTSMGLCPKCGVRYQIVRLGEESNAYKQAYENACVFYEKLASANMKLAERLDAVEHTGVCRVVKHVFVDGFCAECGVAEQESGRTLRGSDGALLCDCGEPFPENGRCKYCGAVANSPRRTR